MRFYKEPILIPEDKRVVFLRVNSDNVSPYFEDSGKWDNDAKRVEELNSVGIFGVNGACVSIGYIGAFIAIFSFCKSPKILLMETNSDDVLYNSFTEMATRRANILQVFSIEQFERYAKHYNEFLPLVGLYAKCERIRRLTHRGHFMIARLIKIKLYHEMLKSLAIKFPEYKEVYHGMIYDGILFEICKIFKIPYQYWLNRLTIRVHRYSNLF